MAKYQWNLYEIRKSLNYFKNLYTKETNEEIKPVINEFIGMYEDLLGLAIKRKNQESIILDDTIKYKSINEIIEEQIIQYQINDPKILNIVLQSYMPFKTTYQKNVDLENIPIVATNEETMLITKDFIEEMVPNSYKKEISKALEVPNAIQISYSKQKGCYSGVTIIDPYFKKRYIHIERENMLTDLANLPHEAFHYSLMGCNCHLTDYWNTYYLNETEGSFANILFGDYFYQNSIKDKNYFNQYFLKMHYENITELVISYSLMEAINDKKHLRLNKFNKLLTGFGLSPFEKEEEILDHLNIPLNIYLKYALSYLVAIDLYYIYLRDPEFAFYLLKNIRFIIQENNIISLLRRNHITFMDDGYENSKKYIKKIESQN